jgi:nucleotide-binding universal stress UspA family protein
MKVLVAVDNSSASKEAVKSALDLANELESQMNLELVNCVTPVLTMSNGSYDESLEEAEQNGQEAMDSGLTEIDQADVDLGSTETTLLHSDGNIVETLTDYIEENDFDMVFMGHRDTSEKKERFVGSTTKKLISHTNIPVVAV